MSLCIAWKYEEAGNSKVYFAADSCVTFQGEEGALELPYGGVKVLALPVRIIPPGTKIPGQFGNPFERIYGMAFVDGYVPAFLLKEALSEALLHLQIAGAPENVTFLQICDFVLKFHRHFHEELRRHLKSQYEVSFFFGGVCPATGRVRVAKFYVDFDSETPVYTEILQGGGVQYDTLGQPAAERRFRQLFELNLSAPPCRVHFAVWRRLREILRDAQFRFVKGAVQHGEFAANGNFLFSGSMDLDFIEGRLQSRLFIRGTEIDVVHQAHGFGDFHLNYTYALPFDEDVHAFDPSHFWNDDGSGIVIDEPVTVVPHENDWADAYVSERDFLIRMTGGRALGFEHIGSTAVPEMASRPVIDILVGVEQVGDPRKPPFDLRLRNYELAGDCGIPGRALYRKRDDGMFDLHVVQYGGEFWNRSIQLRDYLRAHPNEAGNYGLEKVRILNRGSWTAKRYLTERAGYLGQLIALARARDMNNPS